METGGEKAPEHIDGEAVGEGVRAERRDPRHLHRVLDDVDGQVLLGAGLGEAEAGLPSLSGLTRLWLQDNELTGVADLPLLGNLARLNLESNRLGSVAPLLAQTPTLDYLWLAGNPNLDDAELSALRGTGCIVYS